LCLFQHYAPDGSAAGLAGGEGERDLTLEVRGRSASGGGFPAGSERRRNSGAGGRAGRRVHCGGGEPLVGGPGDDTGRGGPKGCEYSGQAADWQIQAEKTA
jgi:hypothetical protein